MSEPTGIQIETSPERRRWRERLAVCNGCDACGHRCVAGIVVSRAEYQRIVAHLDAMPPETRGRVADEAQEVEWPGAPDFSYDACRFRDVRNGRCLIYPVRPLICRLFGHVEWLPCPIDAVPEVAPRGRALFERTGRTVLKTFEDWKKELEETDPDGPEFIACD